APIHIFKPVFLRTVSILYSSNLSFLSFARVCALQRSQQMDALFTLLTLFFFGFLGVMLLLIAAKTIRIVPQATVMLVERLGRFDKVASSGLNLLWPFLDRPRAVYWTNTRPGITSIDLREQCIDLPPQPVITRDNVTIHVC